MDINKHKLDIAVEAYKKLISPRWDNGACVGEIALSESNIKLIEKLDHSDLIYPIVVSELNVDSSKLIEITLQPPRTKSCFFAENLDDILDNSRYLVTPPELIYITDINEFLPSEKPPSPTVQNYIDSSKLAKLLDNLSDFSDPHSGPLKVVFLHKEKLEIVINYQEKDLCKIKCFEELAVFLTEDTHREQRHTIFKEVLLDELRGIQDENKFSHLAKTLNRIYKRIQENYQLYVSEFSFEKTYKDVNEKKLEHVLRINKNFSEIQNQLLAAPIAVLLARSQMDASDNLKNIVIVFITLAFASFCSMLLRNQRASLDAIHKEICSEKELLENRHAAISDRFNDIYEDLQTRYDGHKWMLRIVDLLIGVLVVAVPTSIYLFYYLAEHWADFVQVL